MACKRRDGRLPARLAALAVWPLAMACGEEAQEHELPEGRYHYQAIHPAPGLVEPMRLEGVMVIAESGEDSIAGQWEVPQLHPEMELGSWEGDAYEVMAHPTYFGILTHRLRPAPGRGTIECEGNYTWVAEGGVERTVPVTCSVSAEVAERPAMPARGPEDPIVRPIDPDTLPPRGLSPDAASGPRTDSTWQVR
jgi:hypothetical protein